MRTIFLTTVGLLLTGIACAQINFVEATDAANLDYVGETWGAAWGDADGDGWPDLFCSNHYRQGRAYNKYPSVYMNQGDGTFQETSLGAFGSDIHGAAWVDVDNDGDQELIIGSGPKKPTYMAFHSGFESFTVLDHKVGAGEIGRSAQQLIVDGDNDGRSDLVVLRGAPKAADQAYTSLYWNNGQHLSNYNAEIGFTINEPCILGALVDVDGDRNTEMLLAVNKKRLTVFDQEQIPFVPHEIDNQGIIADLVTGDFNGDLLSDILVIYHTARSYAAEVNDNTISALLYPDATDEGINFKASLPLKIDLFHSTDDIHALYIGAVAGPADTIYASTKFSTTISEYPYGMRPHIPGVDGGIFLGYDSITQWWTLHYNNASRTIGLRADVTTLNEEDIELLMVHGFDPTVLPEEDKFLINKSMPSGTGFVLNSSTFEDRTDSVGIDMRTNARAGVAGDFDNDMDLDIYLATSGGLPNLPNVILENQGDGTFVKVPLAGGAEGSTIGLTDIATTVDFNNDGFLDIFLNNGNTGLAPGPDQLFKNTGNGNDFLAILLQGTASARDASGAVVVLYAGGVAQLREQGSGAQRNGQSHQRLHFGLGSNKFADSIYIYWPRGAVEVMYNVASNQFLTVWENPYVTAKTDLASTTLTKELTAQIAVAPNPAINELSIEWSGDFNKGMSVRLINELGQLVRQQKFQQGQLVSLTELASGTYLISLNDADGNEIGSTKFVKLAEQ